MGSCRSQYTTEQRTIIRDPGVSNCGDAFSDDELRFLTTAGPFQPVLSHYPVNQDLKSKGQTCKFAAKWFEEFPYLEYSVIKNAAFCFACRLFGSGPGAEQSKTAWMIDGVSNWGKMKGRGKDKLGKLAQHFQSISHAVALNRLSNFNRKTTNVDLMIDTNRKKADQQRAALMKYNQTVVSKLLDISRFLCRQGLAFRGRSGADDQGNFIQLVNVLRRHESSFDHWFKERNLRAHQVWISGETESS
ncbi:unnamed protein product [Didymodactylos carnosus]|uniref:TTF-type domain-containing protein n=1 Tax=Didymodactylos carnosus TaxID=1234261 RepID=A0A8S2CMC0_9BILA|nr:unnamed protein product [Didymodactylos carnosus]CAF3500884.1 unnamed protein product [Didymodactylos carnosus]